jgi:hypothetical protein
LLIGAALYLLIRYLFKIVFPSRREDGVQGKPRRRHNRIDEDRIRDASFKDISDK